MKLKLAARPGQLSEAVRATLNALDAQIFTDCSPYPKDDCYWWIVSNGKQDPVAFAGLKPLNGLNKGMGFLCRAGVLPTARGNGLQRRLIKVRVSMARRIALKEVITYTSRENYRSAANLLRSGFRFYRPSQEWGVPHALYFHREL